MSDGVSPEAGPPQDWTFPDARDVLRPRVELGRRRNRRRRILRMLLMLPMTLTLVSIGTVALLRWVPPPTTSFALQWRILHAREPARYWVSWSSISPEAAVAVVAAEDQKFALHNGFDLTAIGDAVEERRNRGRVRGASTISQQVAKNLFLWPGRSWVRKGLEVWFTVWIELLWPKRRILETYLNIAEFGEGVFGVEAAARAYFNQSAVHLDSAQAALLAAVLPNPALLQVARPSRYVLSRQSWIMRQMSRLGGRAYLAQLDA